MSHATVAPSRQARTPFSTALMVTHLTGADAKFSVLLYGTNLLLASVVLSLLIRYLAREPSLLVDDIAEGTLRRITRRRWAALGLNVLAIAVALVAPKVAVGLYLVETTRVADRRIYRRFVCCVCVISLQITHAVRGYLRAHVVRAREALAAELAAHEGTSTARDRGTARRRHWGRGGVADTPPLP